MTFLILLAAVGADPVDYTPGAVDYSTLSPPWTKTRPAPAVAVVRPFPTTPATTALFATLRYSASPAPVRTSIPTYTLAPMTVLRGGTTTCLTG